MEKAVLIVEDNPEINDLLHETLCKNHMRSVQAYSGSEALLCLKQGSFDLILLDLMLPGMTGEAFLRAIKPESLTPVIILTAKDELDSKVDLLRLGADDYVTKPFEIEELMARIEVQLRRRESRTLCEILSHKELTLDRDKHRVAIREQEISLTRQEFKILELLLANPGKVFSKQAIYDYAWDDYYVGEDKTINVHISNIRQKLKKHSNCEYIETIWGIGFKLIP